ncbi:hypothetical protein [Alienimonas chondri]|uniref:Fe2OG dioxygenase domain-containing protein n=1 Tax=Alienimonas chondri TaxID=2681879 RepID=A0ABX1VAN5_9PLAN|nr:hypothetical protein [Alienimonas chondri]NNJ24986.1 hypothetical protein [Alienimonas chondri]
MTAVYFNADHPDDRRRENLYAGAIYVDAANAATRAFCAFARTLSEEAFAPHDPRDAQHVLSVDEYNAVLKDLKPKFIHHPDSKTLIREVLAGAGCDLDRTYADVPRLRTATSHGYLTSGLAYAFKPHRDTWYSPPQCQLNWWLPVYEIEPGNAMAFHPHYWDRAIRNSSAGFNYQDWQTGGRKAAHDQGKKDTRVQSEALEELELEPALKLVPEPGGLIVFSAAHLHSTVPNETGRTRLSIDFRTVHRDDLEAGRGAPNVDSACGGTTTMDYLRAADFTHLPEELIDRYAESRPDWADAPAAFA